MDETHLGDGVYASFENGQIRLRVPAGSSASRKDEVIYLDYYTFIALKEFGSKEFVSDDE